MCTQRYSNGWSFTAQVCIMHLLCVLHGTLKMHITPGCLRTNVVLGEKQVKSRKSLVKLKNVFHSNKFHGKRQRLEAREAWCGGIMD